MGKNIFNEIDLVSFGNFLLSSNRNDLIINKVNLDQVTHADLENWKNQE